MKTIILTLIAIFSLSVGSKIKDFKYPEKSEISIIEQKIDIENFSEIYFGICGELILKQGNEFSIEIKAPENIMNNIETIVKEGKLIIKSNKNIKCKKEEIKIYVTCPELNSIEVGGSGSVHQQGDWNFNNLKMIVSSSGNIAFDQIKINDKIENVLNGSGNIDLNEIFLTKSINSSINGSGNVFVSSSSKCTNNNIEIYGSGSVDTEKFEAENSNVTVLGSDNASVFVSSNLHVAIYGSGNIFCKGNPKIQIERYGSGQIYLRK